MSSSITYFLSGTIFNVSVQEYVTLLPNKEMFDEIEIPVITSGIL